MLRRKFLKGIIAQSALPTLPIALGTVSFAVVPSGPAFAQTKPEIELIKAFAKLKRLLTWVDWAEEAVPKMIDGKIPPQPPGPCSDDLSMPLVAFTNDVDQISVVIDLPAVSYDDLPGSTLRDTRALLANKFSEIQQSTNLFWKLDLLDGQVIQKRQALDARLSALQILSDALLRLATIPLPATYHAAIACWVTVETTYQKRFLAAISALDRLESRSKREKFEKRSEVNGIVLEHQRFLQIEIVQLDKEEAVQDGLTDDYEHTLDSLQNAESENDSLKRKLQDAETRLTAYRLDIQKLKQENLSASGRISTLNSNISEWRSNLKDRYSYCPNGYSYSVCDHDKEKEKWDRRQKNLRGRIKGAKKSILKANKTIANNKLLIERFEAEQSEWTLKSDNLKVLHTQSNALVSQLKKQADEKLTALNKRKYTAPVELLRYASEQESYSLSQLSF